MLARLGAVALGVWLMAAPAVLGYGDPARTNDRIVGPIVAAVAVVAMSEVTRGLRWINLCAGVWLSIAPLVLQSGTAATVNSVVTGIVLVTLASVRGRMRHRYAGGWSALFRGRTA